MIPPDRQLLRAIRGAVAAAKATADKEAGAKLASAELALNVLLQRAERAEAVAAEPAVGLLEALEQEALAAGAELAAPPAGHGPEALDLAALAAEVAARLPGEGGAEVESCRRLSGGFSRETIALSVRKGGETQDVIIRRQQSHSLLDGIGLTVADEYPILAFAYRAGLPVAEPLWLDVENGYSVSHRVAGETLGTPTGGSAIAEPSLKALAELLGRLHALDWRTEAGSFPALFGLSSAPLSRAQATVNELNRWTGYAALHGITFPPGILAVEKWLREHVPEDAAMASLLHGDVGYHNLMFHEGRISALLDWETACFGSPAKDLSQIRKIVSGLVPWERFMGWYRDAGGTDVSLETIGYYEVFSGYNYVVVCEVARQAMLAQAEPRIAYVDLAFPIRAHFYQELLSAARAHVRQGDALELAARARDQLPG